MCRIKQNFRIQYTTRLREHYLHSYLSTLLFLQINATTFEVHSSDDNKVYKFITHDELTAQHWVDAINSVKKDH